MVPGAPGNCKQWDYQHSALRCWGVKGVKATWRRKIRNSGKTGITSRPPPANSDGAMYRNPRGEGRRASRQEEWGTPGPANTRGSPQIPAGGRWGEPGFRGAESGYISGKKVRRSAKTTCRTSQTTTQGVLAQAEKIWNGKGGHWYSLSCEVDEGE